jgi:glutamate dehydrogenase
MLLSDEEFYENKTQIVGEILEKLRGLARLEAELLFKEYESNPGE